MNRENLISLADRPIEERRAIARLGGLARQKQRREQLAFVKHLNLMLEVENYINTYCKKRKSNLFIKGKNFYKKTNNMSLNYFLAFKEDLLEVYENLRETIEQEEREKEAKKKAIRKEINRRYYLKKRNLKQKK